MPRGPSSTLDFSTIGEPEVVTDFVARGVPVAVPAPIQSAVRRSLAEGVPLAFTVPAGDAKHPNVSTLVGHLRKAAEIDKRGLSVKTEEVKNRAGNTTHVKVKFKTNASRIEGRGRKPRSTEPADEAASASE